MASTRVVAWGQRRSATPPPSSRATAPRTRSKTKGFFFDDEEEEEDLHFSTRDDDEEAEKTTRKCDWINGRWETVEKMSRWMSDIPARCAMSLFDRIQSNATAGTSTLDDSSSLEYKLTHPKLFEKRVMNKSRPGPMKYPLFLLGEWEQEVSFWIRVPVGRIHRPGYVGESSHVSWISKVEFGISSRRQENARAKVQITRFVHERPGENIDDARGDVVEDRAFNLQNIFNAYLEDETAVESVDYDFSKNPNRATVTLRRGAANNAERVELFTNARESETSGKDGSFLCAETVRQVSLGYSVDYNTARV